MADAFFTARIGRGRRTDLSKGPTRRLDLLDLKKSSQERENNMQEHISTGDRNPSRQIFAYYLPVIKYAYTLPTVPMLV